MVTLTREQLEERLAALHRASLELVRDLSRNAVLERIAHLAREQAEARYAAIGMVDEDGELVKFIPVGMTESEISRMAHPPKGLGLIGAIREEKQTIRVAYISDDPRSSGFPKNHPIHEHMSKIEAGTEVYFRNGEHGLEIHDAHDYCVGKIATNSIQKWQERLTTIHNVRVVSMISRNRKDPDDKFKDWIKTDSWELPILEVIVRSNK